MIVALVAAVADNGVIGRDNRLPWHLPGDLRYFRSITMGKPVIMGRRTFASIGRPLPGRTNIVLSRDPDFGADGIKVVPDFPAALRMAEAVAAIDGVDEAMVIGGAELYALALADAQRIYLTRVHAEFDGDAFFPPIEDADWQLRSCERHPPDETNSLAFSLCILERREG